MHAYDLILTLTGGLAAALILGFVTQRLGLSPIVGYLLAGTLVGPHTPGFVADSALAEQLAEIGVILLMFGVGLQFHIEELLAVRRVAIPGAVAQSAVATLLGALVARAFGWDWSAGIIFGMALAVASTVVLIRVLADHNDLHTQAGHIAVGWLVVEDLFTVVALVLLPALFGTATTAMPLWMALGLTPVKVTALVAFTAIVGTRVIPRLLDYVAATRSRELFTLTVLVIALGIAVGSSLIFSVSMALGAFLAGMVVGRSDYSLRAASEALPMAGRVRGAVLCVRRHAPGPRRTDFVSRAGGRRPWRRAHRQTRGRTAPCVGDALSVQVGADRRTGIGADRRVLVHPGNHRPGALHPDHGSDERAGGDLDCVNRPESARLPDHPVDRSLAPGSAPALGSSESAICRALRPEGARPPDDDRSRPPRRRDWLRSDRPHGRAPVTRQWSRLHRRRAEHGRGTGAAAGGVDAIYGDATRPETLEAAGVEKAGSLVLGSAGMANSAEVIRIARTMNPGVRVLARAQYLRDVPPLKDASATSVYSGEAEVALAFIEDILDSLGATAEQIDRERARAHRELSGGA